MASEILEAEASRTEASKTKASQFKVRETGLTADRPINHRLFNWITIILLTGWIMVVGVAANTAQMEKPVASSSSTAKAFIRNLL